MIAGSVNPDFEPIIPLSICGSDSKVYGKHGLTNPLHTARMKFVGESERLLAAGECDPLACRVESHRFHWHTL